ncbi:MAG: exo-alpha-sialidase [Deltaproteobacteria bacterium]|nr:exo-alpha-sialidase [Deltaproteobacteria bacterium]
MSSRFSLSLFVVFVTFAAPPASHALISFGPPGPLNSTAATDLSDPDNKDVDREVSLANDGSSTWVGAWSSDNNLGGTIGDDFDLLFTRSTDDGETWSAAASLYSNAASDGTAAETEPCVVSGSGGVWVAAYSSTNTLGDTIGFDNDILFSRSTDNGATWSNPALLNSGGTVDESLELDFQPSLATDGAGRWVAVWKHSVLGGSNPTADQIFFSSSSDNGATWSAQQMLGGSMTANIGLGQGNSVAYNGTGFIAVWGSTENLGANGTDGDIFYSTITNPGFVASAAATLNSNAATDTGADTFPSLSADGSDVVVVWESNENFSGAGTDDDVFTARSTNGGGTWSATSLLGSNATTDVGDDNHPRVANDGSTFVAVWDSNDPLGKALKTDGDIQTARSTDAGATWTDPAGLATTAGKDKGADLDAVAAANASTGAWAVAWESTDTLGKSIGGDEDVLYVRSFQDCPATPAALATCFQTSVAGKSKLVITEGGFKDSLTWNWSKGADVDKAADLADPTTTAAYVMCIYDETGNTPALITELDVAAGGNCYVNPCWTDNATGYLYKHKYGVASRLLLTAGVDGKAKIALKGTIGFKAPALPLQSDSKVSVRLHNLGNGKCFGADFSGFTLNTAASFKGNSD